MRVRVMVLAAALATAGLFAIAAPASAEAEGRHFATTLTGAAEVPPGDPDASGRASIRLDQRHGKVCFHLRWARIDGTVTAAHVHVGPPGTAGPIVVPLFVNKTLPGTDKANGCASGVSKDLIKAIRHHPENYYVNVHSTVFPAGAIRGQLDD